jgi:hypothetical protein
MCEPVPENGYTIGKKSDVWKLYVPAGDFTGFVYK